MTSSDILSMNPPQKLCESSTRSAGHAFGQVGHLIAVIHDSGDVHVEPVVAGHKLLKEKVIWFITKQLLVNKLSNPCKNC